MAQRMAYFRIKLRRLGEAYERFLRDRLEPGGSIILVECQHTWPTTRVGPRHVFQFGVPAEPLQRSIWTAARGSSAG